jgi:MFS family permease
MCTRGSKVANLRKWIGIVGVIIHTSAYSSAQMIVGRVLLGIANGITASILPVYMQETSVGTEKTRSRDIIIALGLAVYGLSIANWIDFGVLKSSQC